jgi:hypothetical protein
MTNAASGHHLVTDAGLGGSGVERDHMDISLDTELKKRHDALLRHFGREDLAWYACYATEIRPVHRLIARISDEIRGGLYGSMGRSYVHMASKYAFTEDNILRVLENLRDDTLQSINETSDSRLFSLKNAVEEAFQFGGQMSYYDRDDSERFARLLEVVSDRLEEIRSETETVMLASF